MSAHESPDAPVAQDTLNVQTEVADRDLVEESFTARAPTHMGPTHGDTIRFKPWHLPRKQWVRNTQWRDTVARLMGCLHLQDRPLRYLGLPGEDLLDLDVLAQLCHAKGKRLRYLGFNTGASTSKASGEQGIAENLIRELEVVDEMSSLSSYNVADIAHDRSVAFSKMREFESFDVVNLDMCGTMTGEATGMAHSLLKRVVQYQFDAANRPWILCFTTAIDASTIGSTEGEAYSSLIRSSASKHTDFASTIEHMHKHAPDLVGNIYAGAPDEVTGRLLTLGLGKWLLSLCDHRPYWKVELASCACYRRGILNQTIDATRAPDLYSLVFWFDPITTSVRDEALLSSTHASAIPSWEEIEKKAALQLARRSANPKDVDCILQSDPAQRKALLDESATLLALRKYDAGQYREWASSVPSIAC